MDIIDKYEIDPKLFYKIVVPTQDSVRSIPPVDLLLNCEKHVLMVGATGTGKTININQYLMGPGQGRDQSIPQTVIPLTITFSEH